ncbi:MAG TPA: translation initiation factor [Candidatus Marinimicrobia bacterium]|jgi:translation initiation factor 1|nr:translation initiation factor [Candidatus Neomarinimicrobiota bacterium]
MGKKSKVVFSTNPDYLDEVIKNVDTLPKEEQQLRVWLKRLGGGRLLTVVKEFVGADDELLSLGKVLKTKCSSGGTVKNGEILIQGDHRDKIVNLLNEKGYKAKASGG